MDAALAFNGVPMEWETEEVGGLIVRVAQGLMDADALAQWLRGKAGTG